MLKQFLNHIETNLLCTKNDRILLAVSGGLDSVVMLHLFHEAGFSIGVAYCNFQLRGAESEGDENFVKGVCSSLRIPCFTHRFQTSHYASENGISIQMAARELRYVWFDELLEKESYAFVATAHHLNDSIESALLNWIHGASPEGLTGIPVKNKKIIRPLLFAKRGELEDYAWEQGIQWREDSSNQEDDYARNFLRHHVIPKLKELNPSLEEAFQRGSGKIQGHLALARAALDELKSKYVSSHASQFIIDKAGLRRPHAAYVLWEWIKQLGFNYDVCLEVIHALDGQSGKRFLGTTHQLVVDRDTLIITEHVNFWNDVTIGQDQDKSMLGAWNMDIEKMEIVCKSENPLEATLDLDKITFPLVWRRWKPGDVFCPLGMEHRKKVSDFLIDTKVPVSSKDTVTVLESSGQIAWVVGYRIDNRFKITDKTRKAISFSIYPHFV